MIWPTQCNCLHEGQLDHSPCPIGMCSEHQHQARTEITEFGCLELNCSLNIHKIVYILPPFLPRLSRTERFYSCALPNSFRMGFLYWFTAGIILLLPDLIAETFFSPKCIQSVAALLFSLASSAVTSVNTEYHLGRWISGFIFTAKTFQGMRVVYYLLPCLRFLPLPALTC